MVPVKAEQAQDECDRLGDGRADYSAKHRRHGVNVQVVTDPHGEVLWLSPALPGRCHDLTAARAHRIINICERQGVPILAHRAYIGAGAWVTTPARRPIGGELSLTQQTVNRALSRTWTPVEGGVARLKSWRIFRRAGAARMDDLNRRRGPHPEAATMKSSLDALAVASPRRISRGQQLFEVAS